ncbi:hypothetical protein [Rossellomorea sp. NRS-1567]|uniref:hypothetical protein n=1 Tax=Rossellomorea sp. NRS-1567 TaxID=3233901 RepID=UPI003D26C4AB
MKKGSELDGCKKQQILAIRKGKTMMNTFTLVELVKKYGSKAQKESLKKKGNLSGKEFILLCKTVYTEWESFTVEGRGSKRIITCYGKRQKKLERVDNRSKNGQGQLVGEFELNSLVVNYLIQKDNKVKPMSLNMWLTELEIVDRKLIGALYGSRIGHLEDVQKEFGKVHKEYNKADNDIEMLDEFIQVSLKSLKSNLVSVFNKLVKAKVIIHQKEVWGCTLHNNHRELKQKEIKEIASLRRTLLNAYALTGRDLFMTRMKEVKAFRDEFAKRLQQELGLKYYYDAHFCVIQDSDLGVNEYLERLKQNGELDFTFGLTEASAYSMVRVYKDKHSERSLKLSKEREKNTTNRSDSDRVKSLKTLKQYAPMWEVLLQYFRCTDNIKINPPNI